MYIMLGQHGCPREFEMPRNKVNFCRLNYYIEIKHETTWQLNTV